MHTERRFPTGATVNTSPRRAPPWPVRKIPLERLSLFAGNLAKCMSTGIDLPRALRTCSRSLDGGELQARCEEAVERVQAGDELHEALRTLEPNLPAFLLPVLRCGEHAGHLAETLQYLERQCRLLAEPTRKLRNAGLSVLAIFALGWLVELIAQIVSASALLLLVFLARSVVLYGGVVVIFLAVYRTPRGRWLVDRCKLSLPLFGRIERHFAINRFFHVLNLLYCTGGMRVEQMIETAYQVITNVVLKEDLSQAAAVIKQGGSLSQALAKPDSIDLEHKAIMLVGEESGTLEQSFTRISDITEEAVEAQLTIFNRLLYRLIVPPMILALVLTMASLLRMLMR
jgi:type IV pilus assembly protein PilC